jgi:predicted DNA-binding transcriptional regulator YafY
VTHEKGVKVEQVVIHTKTKYQHGLLLTKPLHHSQKETLPFSEHEDGCYGEVALMIEPNRELRGKILAYGQYLEVIQPISLREQIIDIFEKQIKQYSHE